MLPFRAKTPKARPFNADSEVPVELIRLLPLSTVAPERVEHLLDAAFGADRHGRTAYRIRTGMPVVAEMSFAALDGDDLVGTIQAWPAQVRNAEGADPIILVGPVAVLPDAQGKGIGKMLMMQLLQAADAGAADAMVMIGDPDYYGRFFGFTADATAGWDVPGPVERHRLLARIRRPGGLRAQGELGPDPTFASRAAAA
jgi:predicted N-acetyltransferase YhbS